MFRRSWKAIGHTRDQLGLWEYRSEAEASEMLNQRQDKKAENEPPEQNRPIPNFARQVLWGLK